jgi:hypothetical protein
MFVISAVRRQRQEDGEFKTSFGYITRFCPQKKERERESRKSWKLESALLEEQTKSKISRSSLSPSLSHLCRSLHKAQTYISSSIPHCLLPLLPVSLPSLSACLPTRSRIHL